MEPRGLLLKTVFRGHNPTPNVADWNGDGKLDLIVGAEDGFLYYFERSFIDHGYIPATLVRSDSDFGHPCHTPFPDADGDGDGRGGSRRVRGRRPGGRPAGAGWRGC